MTTVSTATPDNTFPDDPTERPSENKRLRYFEVCLVLLISLSSSFLSSLYLYLHGPTSLTQGTPFRWTNAFLHHVLALVLMGYVLTRSGRRYRDLGLRWSFRDCGIGALLAMGSFVSAVFAAFVVQFIHRMLYGTLLINPHGREFWGHPGTILLPYLILTPFFEEMIVRAYLMTEIMDLTGSSALAVLVSVLVQASYHLYYGWYGASVLVFAFLVLALHYARYRRALPVIVAHELYDLVVFIHLW
jgi:membrane protease YdiL (CAAX protease family)